MEMVGQSNPVISGSAAAVLAGISMILGSIFLPAIGLGVRFVLFIFGVILIPLGLKASS